MLGLSNRTCRLDRASWQRSRRISAVAQCDSKRLRLMMRRRGALTDLLEQLVALSLLAMPGTEPLVCLHRAATNYV